MTVALVTSSYLPNIGGVETHVASVARELRARGHEVVVWTVRTPGYDAAGAPDGVRVRALPCPLPARDLRSVLAFALLAPLALAAWLAAYARDRPRVLHVHCFGPNGTWAQLLALLVRRPLVLSAHGETVADADRILDTSAVQRRALRRALRVAGAVTACSASALADLRERFGLAADRGTVVFNGVDPALPAEPVPGLPARYLLAVGRMVPTKGFDLLLEAYAGAGLPADVALVLAGDGTARAGLLARVDELGLADRVLLPGRLTQGQVVTAVAGAAGLVVPSLVEPFGIAVLEGWRAGVPVVATTRGGPPEFVTDGVDGWLVDPRDPAALRAAVRRPVDDPAAARVAAAGRERVRDFTWARVTDAYEAAYAAVGAPLRSRP